METFTSVCYSEPQSPAGYRTRRNLLPLKLQTKSIFYTKSKKPNGLNSRESRKLFCTVGIRVFLKGRRTLDDGRKSFPMNEMRTAFKSRLRFTQVAANGARARGSALGTETPHSGRFRNRGDPGQPGAAGHGLRAPLTPQPRP